MASWGQFVPCIPRGYYDLPLRGYHGIWRVTCSPSRVASIRPDLHEVPAPEHQLSFSILDRRAESRFACNGPIEIATEAPERRNFVADLTDISNHGFRFEYQGALLPAGTQLVFRHLLFEGRAKLMWSRRTDGYNEGGCLLIRD